MRSEQVLLAELPNWVRSVVRSVAPALLRATRAAAHQGKLVVLLNIKRTRPFPPVDRGTYRASWQVASVQDGAVLFSDAPHAAFIEYGTRPHWPPLLPILRWVERKKLADRAPVSLGPERRGGEGVRRALDRRVEAMRIARAIQRVIGRRGTKPRKVLERSLPMIAHYLDREIAAALREALG